MNLKAVIALIFMFTTANAATQDGGQVRWSKYFSGSLKQPTKENLFELLTYPKNCEKAVRNVIAATVKYGELSIADHNTAAVRKAKSITKALRSLEDSKNACFSFAANAYIAASTLLLDPASNMSGTRKTPYVDMALPVLSIAIVNRGLVYPIGNSERMSWGGEWKTQKSGSNYHEVLGAYDCNQSRIYIDPYLSPVDLASVFTHELDHLFRDKYISSPHYLNNPRNYTLLDEALSVMLSVGLEYSLGEYKMGISKASPFKQIMPYIFEPFRNSYDRTLYDRERGVWRKFAGDMSLIFSEKFPWNGVGLVDSSNGDRFYEDSHNRNVNYKEPYLNHIYSKLSGAYFESNTAFDSKWFDANNHNNELLILADVLNQITVENPYADLGWTSTNRIIDLKKTLNTFDSVFSQYINKNISPMCSSFIKGIDSGLLDDYSGKSLGRPGQEGVRPGQDSVRPGQEGVRPGQDSVRPGQEGVRPGQDSVRPGQEGVRPGQEGVRPSKSVRPCLNIYNSL